MIRLKDTNKCIIKTRFIKGIGLQKVFQNRVHTVMYTLIALVAFAANSVLCRIALKGEAIDASSFTIIRLLSGVFTFFILLNIKSFHSPKQKTVQVKRWKSSFLLFIYAITFSLAYVSLDTGTGALILFGAVQLTMIFCNMIKGNRLRFYEWVGVSVSFTGLAYLVYPTLTTPSVSGFVLMMASGIAWGGYTLFGRGSATPLIDTANNFKYTMPLVLVLLFIAFPTIELSNSGIILAVLSGSIASALGYTVWYMALRGLSATEAAVVQLSVPVIAAIGGVIFVSEPISERLIVACILVLGGILSIVVSGMKVNSDTR